MDGPWKSSFALATLVLAFKLFEGFLWHSEACLPPACVGTKWTFPKKPFFCFSQAWFSSWAPWGILLAFRRPSPFLRPNNLATVEVALAELMPAHLLFTRSAYFRIIVYPAYVDTKWCQIDLESPCVHIIKIHREIKIQFTCETLA